MDKLGQILKQNRDCKRTKYNPSFTQNTRIH